MPLAIVAFLAMAAEPDPNWQLLFRDPPTGAVYMDLNSVWSRGDERAITARFDFDRPRPGEVAQMLARLEMNCATRVFRIRSNIRYDRAHRVIDSFDLQEGPAGEAMGPAARLVDAACRRG